MNVETRPGTTVEASEDEYIISLVELLQVLWKRLWVVLLSAILLAGAAVGYSIGQTSIYEASIKILVGQERGNDVAGGLGSDVQGLQQLTQTVADLVDTRPVAETVIERLETLVVDGWRTGLSASLSRTSIHRVPHPRHV